MTKVVNSICETCDSEFSLSFNENLVKEHDNIICPFCGEEIESLEEDIQEEFDLFQEETWDE
jgi:DNA-directed RNA polymerase subunit RPC12/RpoP